MSYTDAPPSTRSQIAALEIGECYSRSERLDFDSLTRDGLLAATQALRDALAASVRRAQAGTGQEYTVEVGEWRTRSRDIVLTVIVTRVA